MNEIFYFSQILKSHSFYRQNKDEIHFLYFQLGLADQLTSGDLKERLCLRFPDLQESVEAVHLAATKLSEQNRYQLSEEVKTVCLGEPDYPRNFYAMEDPPLCFSYQGTPFWKNNPCLSIVGSREPSFESLQWMEKELADLFNQVCLGVISGGARGVDQKAHSLSLRAGRPTCVVLPSGLGSLYPANLKDWKSEVLNLGGCFISEYSYEMPMQKYLFHHRNRLIAALGMATLIIEARHRSGTTITAEQACQMGRPVWVLPGHPQDPHFTGSLQLMMEGATMIRHAADLQALFTVEALAFDSRLAGIDGFGMSSTRGSVVKENLLQV